MRASTISAGGTRRSFMPTSDQSETLAPDISARIQTPRK